MNYIELAVAATPCIPINSLHADDRSVPGVYSIRILKWVWEGLSEKEMTTAALDYFHETCPVKVVDDFLFSVFDPKTCFELVEDTDFDDGSKSYLCNEMVRVSDTLPSIFEVTISTIDDEGKIEPLGSGTVFVASEEAAQQKAFELYWTPHLDENGYKPHYVTTCIWAMPQAANDTAPFKCKFCGCDSWIDPSDQTPPPDYCHESDHGTDEDRAAS